MKVVRKGASKESSKLKTTTDFVSRTLSKQAFEQTTPSCAACRGDGKSAKREFSSHAWTALVAWSEIDEDVVERPICNPCYINLREVLIDRVEEISLVANHVPGRSMPALGRRASA